MFPTSASLNKNQSVRYFSNEFNKLNNSNNNNSNKSQSLNRTYTLPRRFKEKFLSNGFSTTNTSNNNNTTNNNKQIIQTSQILPNTIKSKAILNQSSSSINSTSSPATCSIQLLNKSVDSLSKSFKYLEQILLKHKYEIISSISTAILECILELYNQIKSVENTTESTQLKLNLNTNLANFIKWSDSILFYLNLDNYETNQEFNELIKRSQTLSSELSKSVQDLVDFIKSTNASQLSNNSSLIKKNETTIVPKDIIKAATSNNTNTTSSTSSKIISSSPETKVRSQSTSSSPSIRLDKEKPQNKITVNIDDNTCTKTIETKLNSNLIQISTLTCTTNDSNSNTNTMIKGNIDLDTFFDLDKLALELSELSSIDKDNSFNNDKCNYLLQQFEIFAKEFSIKEKKNLELDLISCNKSATSPASCYSTLNRSYYTSQTSSSSSATCYSSPNRLLNNKKKTLFKNTQFKHDLNDKIEHVKSIQIENESQVNKNDILNEKILTKTIEQSNRNKTNFIETNYINDSNLSKLVLDIDLSQENDENNLPSIKLKNQLNTDSDYKLEKINLTSLSNNETANLMNDLNPNFLLIDDDDEDIDDNYNNDRNDDLINNDLYDNDVLVIVENDKTNQMADEVEDDMNDYKDFLKDATPIETLKKLKNENNTNLASFSSESMSNSSLSLSNEQQKQESLVKDNSVDNTNLTSDLNNLNMSSILNINTNLKSAQSSLISLNLVSPTQIILTDKSVLNSGNLQSESSLSESSHLSNSSQLCSSLMSPNSIKNHETNVLSLLDVSHLLEYQSSSSISTSSLTNANHVSLPNSSILRGGDIDALIVLATSASSSVIAAPATLNNNSSHSLPSANINTNTNNCLKDKTAANFLFQEAFLTTYRTILEPTELIKKLIYRYRFFSKKNSKNNNTNNYSNLNKFNIIKTQNSPNSSFNSYSANQNHNIPIEIEYNEKFDLNRLKSNIKLNKMTASAVRNSLTLLVRVLDGLGNELDNRELVELLTNFIFELLIDDELQMARLLRKKLLFKLEKRRLDKQKIDDEIISELNLRLDQTDNSRLNSSKPQIIPYLNNFTKRNQSILDFKSSDIAEQMTLIDLNLFDKIELSEVLLWSTKQSEQHSPNLIKFTEHFNNISYWARSRILESENYKDREKYLIKFLKIMKHLRKMNNFNSYLSILSAVDSGPIQRLDWPKNIIDTIKDFSALIDPKCGFKSLREAIGEAQPPCIPHIGLILQDLTILHIANPDYLPSGNCNFWKRWQQFNILERLRYFKRCNYNFKPNARIQELFNNFKDYIGEDAQYNLSEQLKPRSRHLK